MFFTIPTIMTWTRIVAIPLIIAVFYLPLSQDLKNLTATVMFVVFALTDWFVALIIIGREIAISALREWMAQIGASRSVAVHMLGKVKTTVQMVAIPFLLYDGMLFGWMNTGAWGQVLIWCAALLTVWSMVYYLQKALPAIRQHAK